LQIESLRAARRATIAMWRSAFKDAGYDMKIVEP
jgi:hypothetical protein